MSRTRERLISGSFGNIDVPTWSASGALTGVTLGSLALQATYSSIMIELPITESTGTVASATAEIRPQNRKAAIRTLLPLWPVRPSAGEITTYSGGSALYGAALECDEGTTYDVKVTVTDNAANVQVLVGTVTTRTDNIPDIATLTPTRYVRVGGSDAADGLTPATAWATLDYAWANAPDGAVVQFGPGIFERATPYTSPNSQNGRTTSITLAAQYPACADGGELINDGLRTVFPAPYRTKPTDGAWTQTTLTGPGNAGAPAGAQYTVWKYASGQQIIHLGWSETEVGALTRVAVWKRDGSHLATAAGWAEKLYTNKGYHYGAWTDSNGDVYLRLPGDRNPNSFHIQMATSTFPLMFQAADCRLSGIHIRGWNYSVVFRNNPAVRGIVDHCWLDEGLYNVYLQSAIPGSPDLSSYGADHTIEHNRIGDRGIRGDRTASNLDGDTIPWNLIKTQVTNADNTLYATTKIAANCETSAIGGRGGHRRVVVRHNWIEGSMNGVTCGANTAFDRYAGSGWDVHDNTIRRCADDAIEPELQCIWLKVWSNRIEETLTYLSLGPVHFGPVFYWRNTVWQFGPLGVGQVLQGAQVAAAGVKYSGASSPRARIWLLHNTVWTDDPKTDGLNQFASAGSSDEDFYLRANIVRVGGYVFDSPRGAGRWDEQDNLFATMDATKGMSYRANGGSAVGYKTAGDVASYRTASGGGSGTNVVNGADQSPGAVDWLDALLRDPSHGDLRLARPLTSVRVTGVSARRTSPLIGAEAIGDLSRPASLDLLTRLAIQRIAAFADWCDRQGVKGHVGELGWPNRASDGDQWNRAMARVLDYCETRGLSVVHWATGNNRNGYALSAWQPPSLLGDVSISTRAASPWERYLAQTSQPLSGAFVTGGHNKTPFSGEAVSDASTGFFNNGANRGVYGTDYKYDSAATFAYLAARGVECVTLSFRWERLQPTLSAALDATELGRLTTCVNAAIAAGLTVILQPFNKGEYYLDNGAGAGARKRIGVDAELTSAMFADLWTRVATAFKTTPGVVGYGIMNEPASNGIATWQTASQAACNAIAAVDTSKTIIVPPLAWFPPVSVGSDSPTAWITGVANPIRYEGHFYFDLTDGGFYTETYDAARDSMASGYRFLDTFTVADVNPIPSGRNGDVGISPGWTVSKFKVVSNTAAPTDSTTCELYQDARFVDGIWRMVVSAWDTATASREQWLVFRRAWDASFNGWRFGWDTTGVWKLQKTNGSGSYGSISGGNTVSTGTVVPTAGDVVEVVLAGATITCKVNGATLYTTTDSYLQGATVGGVRCTAAPNLRVDSVGFLFA